MKTQELVCVIPPAQHTKEQMTALLTAHPEIKFVSIVAIDFAGNDTDEKIPVSLYLDDLDLFLNGSAVQTDGSSVVLTGIATLNNAKVDMIVDKSVNWFVDYNTDFIDDATGKPVGTLRMPCFLEHDGVRVDSRSILADSLAYVKKELFSLFKAHPNIAGITHAKGDEIEDIIFTSATELEFWVKTPAEEAHVEELSASQVLQEQYWQRTRGSVRTALEQAVLALEEYGLEPEMGHKEVGGVKAKMDEFGHMNHVMEQLEIDWKYSTGLQTADNELLARTLVREAFRQNGLDVTFQAKPIIGVAGSGEHTHFGLAAKLKSGKTINLFAPTDMKKDFLSAVGYGAIMGLLKHYEVVNPFVSATNDSLNRLKPGFEAPVCIVTSLGHSPAVPSRNRTILAGLVRDEHSPLATRFELRAPNPFTNTYIVLAALYLTILDGVTAAVASGKDTTALLASLSKEAGTEDFYLEKDRAYRSEHDVFEDYTPEERDRLFSKPPATVWENLHALKLYPEKVATLTKGDVFRPQFIQSFAEGALVRWRTELVNRVLPEAQEAVLDVCCLHDSETASDLDVTAWNEVQALRLAIAKSSSAKKSLIEQVRAVVAAGDYEKASALQVELADKVELLKKRYACYRKNIID